MAAEALREYVDICTRQHVSYVAEFVEALSTGQRECSLVDRAVPLTAVDVFCMAQALQRDHDLRTLDLEGNDVGLEGVQALIDALSANPSLKELRLGRNKLGDAAVMVLGNSINHNGLGLRVVDLSHNDITQAGCAALFPTSAARGHSELVELSLYGNRLDGESGPLISNAIRNAVRLKHLHLGYNQLADRGAAAIAKALPLARGVVTIDLSGNRIGPAGGAELAAALSEPSCLLQRANLRHNDFDDATLRLFVDVVRHNNVLVQLFLGFMCPTDQSITESMLQAAASNRTLLLLDLLGWELDVNRTATAVTALLGSATALRALLLEGTQPLRLTIDGLNEKRSSRQWQNVVYVGDDEHAGSAAVNAAQREMRLQQQQAHTQVQAPFAREATPVRETPRRLSASSSSPQQGNNTSQQPLVLNSKPAEEPAQPAHSATPAKPHTHEATSPAQPSSQPSITAAEPLDVESALDRLRNVPTNDVQLRDAAARVAEALYMQCCNRHRYDSARIAALEDRLSKLEQGTRTQTPSTATTPPKAEPAPSSNGHTATSSPPRKSAAESASGFVQTIANEINRRTEAENKKQQQPQGAQQPPSSSSSTSAPPKQNDSQAENAVASPTTAAAPKPNAESSGTTSQPQASSAAPASTTTATTAPQRRTQQPTQSASADTTTANSNSSTPAQRRTAPTKDNSEAAVAREMPAPAEPSSPTSATARTPAEPSGQQALSPRRAPPPSGPTTPNRDRQISIGEQHSPHGPSDKLPIPVAVNERSRSPSHASVHPEAIPTGEPRKPALQPSVLSRGLDLGGRDKAKADAPMRPKSARVADSLSGPAPVNRAASRTANAPGTD